LRDATDLLPNSRIVVIDNRGDYVAPMAEHRLSTHRPGTNLRWIGSANWALQNAAAQGDSICIVLNNDTRLSSDFAYWLASSFTDCADVAVAAACYDDFWLHQRAHAIPEDAAKYQISHAYRQVAFCDGTAIAFSVDAARQLGGLDEDAFPNQGYGADIDYALRARAAGLRCVVSDAAYVQHLRRATMQTIPDETSEIHRHEILTGLQSKWGPGWRADAGLSADSFPAHNSGSSAAWYL
jgi:GT2 family glycosyltransferase